ncbi:MAG: ABC transporter substrate-binding protein [Candidatus Nomurabacteria bacterium]|nr:ABC transporter substrate-binding protein [Candidatus Nomurabacteria bacterium]
MENLYRRIRQLINTAKLPSKKETMMAISSFEKKERLIFFGFCFVLLLTTIVILENINQQFMVEVPMRGGSLSEGVVGTPRFINPILALSDADRDLTSLVYSGLMRKSGDGTLIPDLAKSFQISEDGLSYTFILKDNIYFSNGTPVTADDIIFTIKEAKDPIIKSPIKGNWDGVNVEKQDEKTLVFTLKQPYASFLENATIGIMPASLWGNGPIELSSYNINPIGSGPYQVSGTKKGTSGIINYYDLISFKKFALGKPYLDKITMHFYPNEEDLLNALQNNEIDQMSSITPENAEKLKNEGYNIETSVLPRVFGLFFNQNQNNIFTDKNVIKAIDQAINKEFIIKEVLKGYGLVIDDPIPPNMVAYQRILSDTKTSHEDNLEKAYQILKNGGWTKGADGILEKVSIDKKKKKNNKTTAKLEFSISTGNAPALSETANLIKNDLESIGMKIDVKTFEIGNLNQAVIRPRKYDALLFGEIISHESDLFAFWHSSQRKDPGLNVAIYTNPKVDKILEDALVTVDEKSRIKKYAQFEDQIRQDMPAVFIYSPNFIYVVDKNLYGLNIDHITSPGDRFLNVYNWSILKDKIWRIFIK